MYLNRLNWISISRTVKCVSSQFTCKIFALTLLCVCCWRLARFGFYGQCDICYWLTSMTRINSAIFECHVENTKSSFFRDFILACLGQEIVILAPLYLCSIILLHRTLDFHLRSVENRRCSTNFQAYRLLIRVMLNIAWCSCRYMRAIIFRIARFRIARLRLHRLYARTHWIQSTYFVVLSHRLFAQHCTIFVSTSTWLCTSRPLSNFPTRWTIQYIAILSVRWRWLGTGE